MGPTTGSTSSMHDRGVQAGLLTVVLIAGLDLVARVPLTGGYAIGAVAAATVSTPRRTAFVGAAAVLAAAASSFFDDSQGTREPPAWVSSRPRSAARARSVCAA